MNALQNEELETLRDQIKESERRREQTRRDSEKVRTLFLHIVSLDTFVLMVWLVGVRRA